MNFCAAGLMCMEIRLRKQASKFLGSGEAGFLSDFGVHFVQSESGNRNQIHRVHLEHDFMRNACIGQVAPRESATRFIVQAMLDDSSVADHMYADVLREMRKSFRKSGTETVQKPLAGAFVSKAMHCAKMRKEQLQQQEVLNRSVPVKLRLVFKRARCD